MGFSKQEYWSGLPCPPPGNLPNPGIIHASLTSPALAGRFFTSSTTGKPPFRPHIQALQIRLPAFPIGLTERFLDNCYQAIFWRRVSAWIASWPGFADLLRRVPHWISFLIKGCSTWRGLPEEGIRVNCMNNLSEWDCGLAFTLPTCPPPTPDQELHIKGISMLHKQPLVISYRSVNHRIYHTNQDARQCWVAQSCSTLLWPHGL